MGGAGAGELLLYAGAHLGAFYCMNISFWYSGVLNMDQSC